MPLSEIFNGEVHDWKFTRHTEFSYLFAVGRYNVATVYKMADRKWTVVPITPLIPFIFQGKADGFRTRYAACAYALSIWRVQKDAELRS